ncbi:8-amino-7-oxononanoate synthase, partial [Actinacidiphila alni]
MGTDEPDAGAEHTAAGRPGPFGWLADQSRLRRATGLRRELRPRPADWELLDLAGND